MGFFFTLLYIITGYFTPTFLFGELGQYHIELIIVVLAILCSLPNWSRSGLSDMPQTWALAGLCLAAFSSMALLGGLRAAPQTLLDFLPALVTFFLVVLNFRTKLRLRILIACIFVFAVFMILQGYLAFRSGVFESPYIYDQGYNGEHVLRIRGLGIFNDPNDFTQLIVGLIPCMFFFWSKGKKARNLLLVYLPVAVLVYGMYLTHSRGGMLALMVMAVVSARRKIGLIPGVVGGVLVFVALSAAGFSGGREVSASAGEDRMALWSQGMDMIRHHPMFGVGYNQFGDHTDVGLTAHNTFVVCAAELGLIGVFCWLVMAVATVRNGLALGSPQTQESPAENSTAGEVPSSGSDEAFASSSVRMARAPVTESRLLPEPVFAPAGSAFAPGYGQAAGMPSGPVREPSYMGTLVDSETKAENDEIRRMAALTVLCFAGFFTSGWFISRAYTMALFVNVGIAACIFQMAVDRGIAPPQMPRNMLMKLTAKTLLALLVIVYVIIRVDHFMPK